MTDSIDTSEREAEEPRMLRLPVVDMAAEPAPPPVAAGYEPHPVGTGERIKRLERVNAELVEALRDLEAPAQNQPTQAEAPSEREAREMQEVADKLREAGYHSAANNTERTIADIKSGNMPRAVIGAALATQQAVQAEPGRRVYLVATGELHEGEETYTRHDDAPPPLCDSECLYATPPAPGQVERERLAWLHSPASNNVDGYEWGIFRVKWEGGKAIEVCHTYSDFSDLDAAIRAARSSEGGSNEHSR